MEISAAQFFEIWHHYDSDGDSFSLRGGGGAGEEGGEPRGAGRGAGSPWPGREQPVRDPPAGAGGWRESLEGAVTLSVVGNGFMDGKELQNFIQELQQARKKAGLVG